MYRRLVCSRYLSRNIAQIVALIIVAIVWAWASIAPAANIESDQQNKNLTKVFRAGAYAIDITPLEFPVLVNGGVRERVANEVHDPLHARCIVLDDSTVQIAIVVVDSCMVPRSLADKAKAMAAKDTGIPSERILISATHTHSAPSLCGCLGTDCDERYASWLPGKIAEGIHNAQKNLQPARVGWAVGRDENNVYCRRFLMKPGTARTNLYSDKRGDRAQMNPGHNNANAIRRTGPVDPDVTILSVQTRDCRPLALLGNYSTHYAGAPALSADYFAVFASEIGRLIGAKGDQPRFVGIMSNGTSGDANCSDFKRRERRKYDYLSVGRDVAQAAFEAYKTIKYYDWVPLEMREQRLMLDVRLPTKEEIIKAREFMKMFAGRKPRNWEEVYARETVELAKMGQTRELKLQAIRIGDLGIAAIPCEVYGSTGLAIKAASPLQTTMNISLANGCEGYIAPPEQHKLGGYTTWRARTSCLEEMAEPKIKATVVGLLVEVATARGD
jgi:neutral ceramidase